MNDIKLLDMPKDLANWLRSIGVENGPYYYGVITSWVEDYARANVAHHTGNLLAEVERLRTDNGAESYRAAAIYANEKWSAASARAKQLEEALRKAKESIDDWAHFVRSRGGELFGLQGELDEIDAVLNREGDDNAIINGTFPKFNL